MILATLRKMSEQDPRIVEAGMLKGVKLRKCGIGT